MRMEKVSRMRSLLRRSLHGCKVLLVLTLLTMLFYQCIIYLSNCFLADDRYDAPQSNAVKVFGADITEISFIRQLQNFYRDGI